MRRIEDSLKTLITSVPPMTSRTAPRGRPYQPPVCVCREPVVRRPESLTYPTVKVSGPVPMKPVVGL